MVNGKPLAPPDPNIKQLKLKLNYVEPYNWDQIIGFFSSRAIAGIEEVSDTAYRRSIHLDSGSGQIAVTPNTSKKNIDVRFCLSAPCDLEAAERKTKILLDLYTSRVQVYQHLQTDPLLAPLVASNPGVVVPGSWDLYELVIRAILGQQISVKAAGTLAGRLVSRFGQPITHADSGLVTHLFPDAHALLKANLDDVGVTRKRAEYIKQASLAFEQKEFEFDFDTPLDKIEKRLCQIAGIGPWTAQYIAMRGLNQKDAFPVGDLVLIKKMQKLSGQSYDKKQLQKAAEHWRPYRAYAALYLWSWNEVVTFSETN